MKQSLFARVLALGYSEIEAKGLILSGKVRVDGRAESRPGFSIPESAQIQIVKKKQYPSRSAYKLKGALELWKEAGLAPTGKVCVDIGASHGGFSQVLLEEGARRIFAIDVAYGIFDFALRNDPRICLLEKRNVRHISTDWFSAAEKKELKAHPPLFITCDVSFMALGTVLDALRGFLQKLDLPMQGVFLFKPQFQNSKATDRGILKDNSILLDLQKNFENEAKVLGFQIKGRGQASIQGRKGNQEFVYWLEFLPGICSEKLTNCVL